MVKKQTSSIGKKIAIGAGVTAALAGAYMLFGPEGKKNRKKLENWSVKMKDEALEKFKKAKSLTEPIYEKIMDELHGKYSKMKEVNKAELEAMMAEMHKRWKNISKDIKSVSKSVLKKKAPAKSKRTAKK